MILAKLLALLGFGTAEGNDRSNHTPGKERSGGVMKPFRMRYTVGGKDHYTIDFRPASDGIIKMFAIDHPADPWGKSVQENHLYRSKEICVAAGREPRTAERARAIAQVWAAGWSEYLRTGKFPSGKKRVNVPDE